MGAAGRYALDEALGESRDACVVVLVVRVRVCQLCLPQTRSRRGGEDTLSTPARKLIAESNATPNKEGAASTLLLDWKNEYSPRASPHHCLSRTSILSTTHLHLLLCNPTRLPYPNYERTR